jgi:mRNA interferase RelE/StbE
MANYDIEISRTAERQLKRLDRPAQIRLLKAIVKLADDPLPRGIRKLKGYADVFRLRVGAFRVLYGVEEQRLVVIVLKIGHRREVYRDR